MYICLLFLERSARYARRSITCDKNNVKCFIFFVARSITVSLTADITKNYAGFSFRRLFSEKKPPRNSGFPSRSSAGLMSGILS